MIPLVVEDMAADSRAVTLSHIQGWPAIGPGHLRAVAHRRRRGRHAGSRLASRSCRRLPRGRCAATGELRGAGSAGPPGAALTGRRASGWPSSRTVTASAGTCTTWSSSGSSPSGLSLQSVSRVSEVPQVRSRIEAAVDDLDATIKDIRRSIFALGALEETADLQTELTNLVDRAAAIMKFRPTLRAGGPLAHPGLRRDGTAPAGGPGRGVVERVATCRCQPHRGLRARRARCCGSS